MRVLLLSFVPIEMMEYDTNYGIRYKLWDTIEMMEYNRNDGIQYK